MAALLGALLGTAPASAPVHEASPWEWGWEAALAIGTIVLAIATAGLAGATLWVARKTRDVAAASNAEIVADWRPVLLQEGYRLNDGTWLPGLHATREVISINFQNYGRGPALDVIGVLDRDDVISGQNPQRVGNGVAPNGRAFVGWSNPNGPAEEGLWDVNRRETGYATYGDLAGNGYRTRFIVRAEYPNAWLEWQGVEEVPDYVPPTAPTRADDPAAPLSAES